MTRKKLYNQPMGGAVHLRFPVELERRISRICIRKGWKVSTFWREAAEHLCDELEGKPVTEPVASTD